MGTVPPDSRVFLVTPLGINTSKVDINVPHIYITKKPPMEIIDLSDDELIDDNNDNGDNKNLEDTVIDSRKGKGMEKKEESVTQISQTHNQTHKPKEMVPPLITDSSKDLPRVIAQQNGAPSLVQLPMHHFPFPNGSIGMVRPIHVVQGPPPPMHMFFHHQQMMSHQQQIRQQTTNGQRQFETVQMTQAAMQQHIMKMQQQAAMMQHRPVMTLVPNNGKITVTHVPVHHPPHSITVNGNFLKPPMITTSIAVSHSSSFVPVTVPSTSFVPNATPNSSLAPPIVVTQTKNSNGNKPNEDPNASFPSQQKEKENERNVEKRKYPLGFDDDGRLYKQVITPVRCEIEKRRPFLLMMNKKDGKDELEKELNRLFPFGTGAAIVKKLYIDCEEKPEESTHRENRKRPAEREEEMRYAEKKRCEEGRGTVVDSVS